MSQIKWEREATYVIGEKEHADGKRINPLLLDGS